MEHTEGNIEWRFKNPLCYESWATTTAAINPLTKAKIQYRNKTVGICYHSLYVTIFLYVVENISLHGIWYTRCVEPVAKHTYIAALFLLCSCTLSSKYFLILVWVLNIQYLIKQKKHDELQHCISTIRSPPNVRWGLPSWPFAINSSSPGENGRHFTEGVFG